MVYCGDVKGPLLVKLLGTCWQLHLQVQASSVGCTCIAAAVKGSSRLFQAVTAAASVMASGRVLTAVEANGHTAC